MHYYLVWVRSQKYRGHDPLTYSSAESLNIGQVVQVELQKELVNGFISHEVTKPVFSTKPVNLIYQLPVLPSQTMELVKWLQKFYAATLGVATQQVLPATLTTRTIAQLYPIADEQQIVQPPPLTVDQEAVVKNIENTDTYLLHGKTGSGKTRIYLELSLTTLASNRSAIILTPEISLTSQLALGFHEHFGERVVILHSQLSPSERQIAWLKILTATVPLIIIGPRSALFSPVKNIGLIVIDEAHETAYKQEQAPYYHATRVASQLAKLHGAVLLLGTATPSIADYFLAEQRHKPILRLTKLATSSNADPTSVRIIDLKDRSHFSRSQQLSTELLTAVQNALSRNEQSLIYLNRRGTARVVLCENCGWQATCPHCDLPLIYHADTSQFRCHTCGYREPLRASCPSCGHPSVLFKSFGTKAVFEEIQRLFPEARVQRFDTDNSRSERFEQHYHAIRSGGVDILVGTQLLAKGLDLPKLSTLGVVLAESSLYVPDFSANERTYQLLNQVLGRIGRGHVESHAIIQTYHPESAILSAAISGEWDTFYKHELLERRKFHFPPYYHLLKLSCRRASAASAEAAANKLKMTLAALSDIEIDGPVPAFHEKLQGKYQYQLVIKTLHRAQLLAAIKLLPSGWTFDIDPINLL